MSIKKSSYTRKVGTIILSFGTAIVFLLSVATPSHAEQTDVSYGGSQEYLTAADWSSGVSTRNIGHDTSGNTYTTGRFYGSIDFDPTSGTDTFSSPDFYAVFITKMNANGSYGWTKVFAVSGSYVYSSGFAVTTDGNVYVTLQYSSTIDLDPGIGVDSHPPIGGTYTMATVKLSSSGAFIQATVTGGTDINYTWNITLDSNNNLYAAGSFKGTTDFDPNGGTDSKTSNGDQDIFLTKINADGSYGWTKTMGGSGRDYASLITIDTNNNVVIGGPANSTSVDFDPTGGTDVQTTNPNAFFTTKFNADGSYNLTRVTNPSSYTYISGVRFDNLGNMYQLSSYGGTADFDTNGGVDNHISAGGTDIALTKINADGSYGWTKTIGSAANEHAGGLAIDSHNNVYLGSYFQATVDFDSGPGVDNKTSVNGDFAFTRINADGSYGWTYQTTTQTGGYTYLDAQDGMFINTDGSIYYTAVYGGGSINLNPLGGSDIRTTPTENTFLTKISLTTYQQVIDVASGLSVAKLDGVDATLNNTLSGTTQTIRVSKTGGIPIADISITFNTDPSLIDVTADSDATTGTAFAHNLTSVTGAASSFTLFIPKLSNDTGVGICPGATTLAAVNNSCTGLYYLTTVVSSNLSTVTINGVVYWKVTGLTGTGGFSTITPSSGAGLANTGDNQTKFSVLSSSAFGLGLIILLSLLFNRIDRRKKISKQFINHIG
ncbi:hypothetical protein H0W80_00705 [Candidatus Saccharibacteria bacterium]|nr:hypothetical protein [Candidatus Saccharibacteria bacterium]